MFRVGQGNLAPYPTCSHPEASTLTAGCAPRVGEAVTGVMVMVLVTLLPPGRGDRWFLGARRTVPVGASLSAVTVTGLTVMTGLAPSAEVAGDRLN